MIEKDNVYNMDCLDGLRLMEDEAIDLTVTSPPYDNLREYNGNIAQWSFDKFKLIANELYRVTKRGGVIVWIVNDGTVNGSETGTSFRQALYFKEVGFNLHDTMIWEKDTFALPESNRYYSAFEYMFVFSKGTPNTFNAIKDRKNKFAGCKIHGTFRDKNGGTITRTENWCETEVQEYGSRFNVWEIATEKNNTTGHPAVYPVQLAKDHIISWSNEGDTVLDPFMGSGTTAVAAIYTDRHYIGFELDSQYHAVCLKRIDDTWAHGKQLQVI